MAPRRLVIIVASQTKAGHQDVALFSGDIAENIRYPRPNSSDTEVGERRDVAGLF